MIKGTLKEQKEYEEFIRGSQNNFTPEIWQIWRILHVRHQYLLRQHKRLDRDASSDEIAEVNFVYVCSQIVMPLLNVGITFLEEELIPLLLTNYPQYAPAYTVDDDELVRVVFNGPKRIYKAAFERLNLPRAIYSKAMAAYDGNDSAAFLELISTMKADDMSYAYHLCSLKERLIMLVREYVEDKDDERGFNRLFRELERFVVENLLEGRPYRDMVVTSQEVISDLDEEEVGDLDIFGIAGSDYTESIRIILYGTFLLEVISKEHLGSFDPITQIIKDIIEANRFQRIASMYLDRETMDRDFSSIPKRYEAFVKKLEGLSGQKFDWFDVEELKQVFLTDNVAEPSSNQLSQSLPKVVVKNEQLRKMDPFTPPSRIRYNVSEGPLGVKEMKPTMEEIYEKFFADYIDDMSEADFLYLFGIELKMPETFNPPYYWNGEEDILKALLRILYVRQPQTFGIFFLGLKENTEHGKYKMPSHDWSTNKNRVPYLDLQDAIIEIVKRKANKKLEKL